MGVIARQVSRNFGSGVLKDLAGTVGKSANTHYQNRRNLRAWLRRQDPAPPRLSNPQLPVNRTAVITKTLATRSACRQAANLKSDSHRAANVVREHMVGAVFAEVSSFLYRQTKAPTPQARLDVFLDTLARLGPSGRATAPV